MDVTASFWSFINNPYFVCDVIMLSHLTYFVLPKIEFTNTQNDTDNFNMTEISLIRRYFITLKKL